MRRWLFICLSLLLGAILTACFGPAPAPTPGADFSVSLVPSQLDIHITETAIVALYINRTKGFTEPIAISLEGDIKGLKAKPLTIIGNEGNLSIEITEGATLGTSFPTVKAVSSKRVHMERLTLRISQAVASVSKVSIQDNADSSMISQGVGERILQVEGTNLERATAFTLGDLPLTLVPGGSSTLLKLEAVIAHGASPGAKDLVIKTSGAESKYLAALIVTAITSGPRGNDSTGSGTPESPYRSLTKALSLAESGDTVYLLRGSYTAENGEMWSSITENSSKLTEGISIEGESSKEVILEGPGPESTSIGLALTQGNKIKNISLKNFAIGVLVLEGSVDLATTSITESKLGLGVQGGTTSLADFEFKDNTVGIAAMGTAKLELENGSSHDNKEQGLLIVDGSSRLNASNVAFFNNVIGLKAANLATVRLENCKLYSNQDKGLVATEQTNLFIAKSEIYANLAGGLMFSGDTLKVRQSSFHSNLEFGAYIEGEPKGIDFGTFADEGQNSFENNARSDGGPGGDQLLDARTDRATLGEVSFTISATTFNGFKPAPDVYPGDGIWPFFNSPYFSILGQNQVIRFY